MHLRVLHDTLYRYSEPVHAVAMEARLQPASDNMQNCLRYRLTVSPKAAVGEYTTYAELVVEHWTILRAEEVRVTAESVVETRERSLIPIEAPPSNIDTVEQFAYIQPTLLTRDSPAVRAFAAQFARLAAEDWYQAALAIREAVYHGLGYEPGRTTTQTTADDVMTIGAGVCQDFSHLMIAALRALRIPARYVSGYLNPVVNQPTMMQLASPGAMMQSMSMGEERRVRSATASHAWCEVYMGPGAGWRGFCPTNNLLVDQHFVRIGCGRDYRDTTPIKGVHRGSAREEMIVVVSVAPIDY